MVIEYVLEGHAIHKLIVEPSTLTMSDPPMFPGDKVIIGESTYTVMQLESFPGSSTRRVHITGFRGNAT